MRLASFPLALLVLAGCGPSVPDASEWPDRESPLLRYAVWVEAGGKVGSGVLLYSGPGGALVLTAAPIVQVEKGFLEPEETIRVGVFAGSHEGSLAEPFALYPARVVTLAGKFRERPDGTADEFTRLSRLLEGFSESVELSRGADLAVLWVLTDRTLAAAPLHDGSPGSLDGREGDLLAVAPEMFPHLARGRVAGDSIEGSGAAGAALFVDGRVAGLDAGQGAISAGPARLRSFLTKSRSTSFLVER